METYDETVAEALIRMNEQWGPEGYEITYTPGQLMPWHAKFLEPGAAAPSEWHAPTSQRLHMALYDHWAKDFDLPDLPDAN
jgi:hypothetical protein